MWSGLLGDTLIIVNATANFVTKKETMPKVCPTISNRSSFKACSSSRVAMCLPNPKPTATKIPTVKRIVRNCSEGR